LNARVLYLSIIANFWRAHQANLWRSPNFGEEIGTLYDNPLSRGLRGNKNFVERQAHQCCFVYGPLYSTKISVQSRINFHHDSQLKSRTKHHIKKVRRFMLLLRLSLHGMGLLMISWFAGYHPSFVVMNVAKNAKILRGAKRQCKTIVDLVFVIFFSTLSLRPCVDE
jgi:hypothetical protein